MHNLPVVELVIKEHEFIEEGGWSVLCKNSPPVDTAEVKNGKINLVVLGEDAKCGLSRFKRCGTGAFQ